MKAFAITTVLLVSFFLILSENTVFATELPSAASANLDELHAQHPEHPEKISLTDMFFKMPETSWDGLKTSFSKESLPWWGLILGSTAVLIKYDEDIYDETQEQGRKWGIGNEDNTHPLVSVGPWDLRFPTDTGSTLYFLGDGITHLSIAFSFLGYGYFSENNRPYNTGIQLIHGMAVSTFFSQILKRSFGRESPIRKTEERGAWRPFPSFKDYNDNTAKYDAMPSGHIMTATLTFTVIIENYPEYSHILYPLEITWLTLLGWQMVNNGVHWASDYPLGIAMGYVFGKAAAKLGKPAPGAPDKADEISWMIVPSYSELGVPTANLIVDF